MKKILFVCVENSCRSQMAEGFAKAFAKGAIEAYSAGSRPSGRVNPHAVEVMAEIGIDIANARSKGFDALPQRHFDWAISMGCADTCPAAMADHHAAWHIADPKGKTLDGFRDARDAIKLQVQTFLAQEHII